MPRAKTPAGTARASMKELGIYKAEFEPIIKIYGELVEQYQKLTLEFTEGGYKYSECTQTGHKKSPIVTTLEALRKDILTYAVQLGLTPQGLLKTNSSAFTEKASNKIANTISGLLKEIDSG